MHDESKKGLHGWESISCMLLQDAALLVEKWDRPRSRPVQRHRPRRMCPGFHNFVGNSARGKTQRSQETQRVATATSDEENGYPRQRA